MTSVQLTHIGGPTMLVELDGWRILTDPTFDPPGRTYHFGWGSSSTKVAGPAIAPADIGAVDAVLLTHDHHADNLDDAGRALLANAGVVVTTTSGAVRLGRGARALAPGDTTRLADGQRPPIEITATPARHGPPLTRRLTGEVIGFALRWPGQVHGALWFSGDTVLHRRLHRALDRIQIGVAVVHVGAARFKVTGPLRFSMTADEAIRLSRQTRPNTTIAVHCEGWSHFREGPDAVLRTFQAAPTDLRDSLLVLPIGTTTTIVN